jgi:hypothetical protein
LETSKDEFKLDNLNEEKVEEEHEGRVEETLTI